MKYKCSCNMDNLKLVFGVDGDSRQLSAIFVVELDFTVPRVAPGCRSAG